jgi:hypothetical protein
MTHDILGNPVGAMRGATLRAVDDFIEGYLAYETRAEGIVAAADADPECCLANVYAGFLWMFLESPDAARRAAKYLDAARQAAPRATRREQLNAALLGAWAADEPLRAFRLSAEIAADFPRDLVVVKTQQYFEFNRGNSAGMLRAALDVLADNADVPYMHGMAAFAYEQCHLLAEAETEARTALEEGARFLEEVEDTWTGLNSFMLTHLWWHLALFHISQGRQARVLEIYDRHCWGVAKDYSQDQIGAVSLLARMELAGIDVGDRWCDLGAHLAARAHDTVLPFLSMQYLYGLARAGRPEADLLLRAVRQAADDAPPHAREVWRDVALPACEGLHAHAHGRHDAAWRLLSGVLPRMIEAGGSHAQRDLFAQIALDAAIQSGRYVLAQQLLELRRGADPAGVPVNSALALVYAELGLATLAEQAGRRAADTRRRHAV